VVPPLVLRDTRPSSILPLRPAVTNIFPIPANLMSSPLLRAISTCRSATRPMLILSKASRSSKFGAPNPRTRTSHALSFSCCSQSFTSHRTARLRLAHCAAAYVTRTVRARSDRSRSLAPPFRGRVGGTTEHSTGLVGVVRLVVRLDTTPPPPPPPPPPSPRREYHAASRFFVPTRARFACVHAWAATFIVVVYNRMLECTCVRALV